MVAGDRSRTCDLHVRSVTLYPAELRPHCADLTTEFFGDSLRGGFANQYDRVDVLWFYA